jgi:hypothetical protein
VVLSATLRGEEKFMRRLPIIAFVFVALTTLPATAAPTWDFTSGFTQVYASNGSTDTWYAGESWGSIYASDPGSSESQASISDSSIH